MIKHILDLLIIDDHLGQSEIIEIAKGKNEFPKTFKRLFKQFYRELKWLKK
ncbi:hypothetical protein UFOVP324_14 [uncultured Caudovirales phage]|uniref:Uncharacterized protein n=1 Tax=uncultured Caudovirales phage TaxID=2100421 RepID=A0A6J5LSN6_9CAUD|nr:hypothetical protein UFOVP324_14 [uncultured Caudovirales phage]